MKWKIQILCILAAVCLLLSAGCAGNKTTGQKEPANAWYHFTDAAGVEILLPQKPEKVAVLFSSYADLWNIAGGTVQISVGESAERGFVDSTIPLVDSGAGKTINNELLLSYQPDFVICSADIPAQKETAAILNENGIPAAQFHVESFEDYLAALKICTDITGNPDAYQASGVALKTQISDLLEKTQQYTGGQKMKILFIRAGSTDQSTKAKTAEENFVCRMLDELGTYNIAENAPILLDGLSFEEILSEDPDYIFFSFMGKEAAAKVYVESLLQENTWKSLTAVKSGNYTFLPKELFHFKPNAKWADAYRYLAGFLYPGLAVN